jgi:hypothetical protein
VNDWVKLQEPYPSELPEGSQMLVDGHEWTALSVLRLGGDSYHGRLKAYDGEIIQSGCLRANQNYDRRVWKLPLGFRFEGSEVVRVRECSRCEGVFPEGDLDEHVFPNERVCRACAGVDDLGDTPEHLRPLLRAARGKRQEALVSSEREQYGRGYLAIWSAAKGSGGYATNEQIGAHEFATVTGIVNRNRLELAIREGRAYPTADARRIGREEFGMVFDGDSPTAPRVVDEPKRIELPRACACGATSNLRAVGRKLDANRALALIDYRCGACEQARRRAEIRAEMDRKLPKVARGVLRTWPPHSSGVSWED